MTDYISIYDKAIASLDDPTLTQVYTESKIDFCAKMYTHLMRAIWLFNTPYSETEKLSSSAGKPDYKESYAVGDGVSDIYTADFDLTGDGTEIVEATVDGRHAKGVYDKENKTFIFNEIPVKDSQIVVRGYLTGGFSSNLDQTEETILALLLVSCWSEKEENFLLDIRRLLTTSDFKLNDSASVLRSKVSWHYTMYEQAQKLMNNYTLNLAKRGFYGR